MSLEAELRVLDDVLLLLIAEVDRLHVVLGASAEQFQVAVSHLQDARDPPVEHASRPDLQEHFPGLAQGG